MGKWFRILGWDDQETIVFASKGSDDTKICVSSYSGLHHHFAVVDTVQFYNELSEVEEISSSKAKELIKASALDSIERIFADDLD